MLVSERWLTNADRRLRELSAPKTKRRKQGLFYQFRPFLLHTNWKKNDDDEWTATALPIVDYKTGRADLNATVEIFAPIHEVRPPGFAMSHRFFGLLRGDRWEYVGRDDLFRSRLKKTLVPTKLEVDGTTQALTAVRATITLEKFTLSNSGAVSDVKVLSGGWITYETTLFKNATGTTTWTSGNFMRGITGLETDTIPPPSGNFITSVAEGTSATIYEWVEEENA